MKETETFELRSISLAACLIETSIETRRDLLVSLSSPDRSYYPDIYP